MPAPLKILSPQEYRLQELTAPAHEPVSVSEAKAQLRIGDSAQDSDIAGLIVTARALCEAYAGKVLVSRTLAVFLDEWPQSGGGMWWDGVREGVVGNALHAVRLPISPVSTVDAIYVHDEAGGARTLTADDYGFDPLGGRLTLMHPPAGGLRAMNAYEIRVTAGYGAAVSVPSVYKQAIRQLVAHMFAHRGDTPAAALTACGAAALLAPFREVSLR